MMRHLARNKNLILSICSLSATLLLLIVCVLGWYVVNKEASVTGVVGTTNGNDDFSLKLEYYDGDSWEEVTDFNFEDMFPGDSINFRLNVLCNTNSITEISTSFTGISSKSHTLVVDNGYIKLGDIVLYEIDQNNKVTVNTNETLYTISNDSISLDDYKLEDACKVYYIEKRLLEEDDNSVPVIEASATGEMLTNEFISNVEVLESSNLYFAVRYENLESNNYYAYQILDINQLIVNFG